MSASARVPTLLALALLACLNGPARAQEPAARGPLRFGDPVDPSLPAFFPGADLDPALPGPDALLGQALGSRLARHAEIVAALESWAALSPRMVLRETGRTHEGRPLLVATITSPENHARLDRIREDIGALADPRGLDDEHATALVERSPAVAWMGYSIHGDETSGADAGLAVAHLLVADRSEATARLLEQVVVVLDPCMNPDGRERLIGMVEQMSGFTTVLDDEALQRGRWPWGRGNHYLFDLNRDWMTGIQPETRARWAAAGDLPLQLFVDAHEMGALDTFLFYPQSQPHNPYLPTSLDRWHGVFAGDIAAAFDAHGWSYYTREWADGWGPYYSDAWASLRGAVGMLYEQAGLAGFPLTNRAGQVVHYRDTVRHQAVASLASLHTLADHRAEVLADFLASRRAAIDPATPGNERMLAIRTGRNEDRERALTALLVGQQVVVRRLSEPLTVHAVQLALGERLESLELPAGTLLVPVRQPLGALVKAYLSFDVRLDEATLLKEREDLERGAGTNLYDGTAWSLPLMHDLDALWCDAPEEVPGSLVAIVRDPVGVVVADPLVAAPVAWAVDGDDDVSVRFAAAALGQGLVPVVADEPFTSGGRRFPRGTVVLRASDNGADLGERVQALATSSGATAWALSTGRSPDAGPDLGGGHFVQLERPRVAMLANMPVAPDSFGHLWHVLDVRVGVPVSFLDATTPGAADLRRYNVIILPPSWGGLLDEWADALQSWVEAGGTLIAVGGSAEAVAAHEGLGSVVLRRDVLDELDGYAMAAQREAAARHVSVDLADLWGDAVATGNDADAASADADADADADAETSESSGDTSTGAAGARVTGSGATQSDAARGGAGGTAGGAAEGDGATTADALLTDDDAERQDAWERRFAPAGVLLRGLVDDRSYLTFGCGDELPVLVSGSAVLLSRAPVETAVRLADASRLRLSGLLWPEARGRLADSAWLTRESLGAGQVVLFADVPGYRGQFLSGARLFGNAVVYGPGLGASAPLVR